MDIPIGTRQAVNLPALRAELRAALGEAVTGVSHYTATGAVVAVFDTAPVPAAIAAAEQIVAAHDPTHETAEQVAVRVERADAEAARDAYQSAVIDIQNALTPLADGWAALDAAGKTAALRAAAVAALRGVLVALRLAWWAARRAL